MGKQAKAPLPPDYTPIANASAASAAESAAVAREQLAWAREQYNMDREVSNRVIDAALERTALEDERAGEQWSMYKDVYEPIERQQAADAATAGSVAKQEQKRGAAQADVAQQFDQARKSAADKLESFGLDPGQTRYAALDLSTRTQQAAAAAAAGNQAASQEEAVGRALRSEAINVGRGYPGAVAQTYNTALQSGNQAVNAGLATTGSGSGTMGTPVQWSGQQNAALGTWGNALNQGFANQMSAYNANAQRSSGLGSLIGLVGGVGLRAATGGMFAKGGPVTPTGNGAGHPGMAIPVGVSPSGGATPDDVPARLTAGEFIIPDDVTRWKGEEFFQKLIEKSRVDKDGAGAQPTQGALPMNEKPAVATALPVKRSA